MKKYYHGHTLRYEGYITAQEFYDWCPWLGADILRNDGYLEGDIRQLLRDLAPQKVVQFRPDKACWWRTAYPVSDFSLALDNYRIKLVDGELPEVEKTKPIFNPAEVDMRSWYHGNTSTNQPNVNTSEERVNLVEKLIARAKAPCVPPKTVEDDAVKLARIVETMLAEPHSGLLYDEINRIAEGK